MDFKVYGLKDNEGNPVQIGDLIKVWLPEIKTNYKPYVFLGETQDPNTHAPPAEIVAELSLNGSLGFIIIVKEVLTDPELLKDSDLKLTVGKRIKFKRTKWKWHLHEVKTWRCSNCGSANCEVVNKGNDCESVYCFSCQHSVFIPF